MKIKLQFKIACILSAIVLVFSSASCLIMSINAVSDNKFTEFNSGLHKDMTDSFGLSQGSNYLYEYDSNIGAKIYNQYNYANRQDNIKAINTDILEGQKKIYLTSDVKLVESIYLPNSQYQFPFIPIASIKAVKQADNAVTFDGYIGVYFKGNNEPARFGFIRNDLEGNITWDFSTFNNIKTSVGDSHNVKYELNVENNTINLWIDNSLVLENYLFLEGCPYAYNMNFQSYSAGVGSIYMSSLFTNYRIYRDKSINKAPVFNQENNYDITQYIGLAPYGYIGYKYDELNSAYMYTDVVYGSYSNIIDIDKNYIAGGGNLYCSGKIKYSRSAYEPNAQYHYPYVVLAKLQRDSQEGYLVLRFPAGGQTAKLSFMKKESQGMIELEVIKDFTSVITNISDSHDFVYTFNKEKKSLSMWIDGIQYLEDIKIDDKYSILENSAGAGMENAQLMLTNYRIWIDGNGSNLPIFEPVFNENDHLNLVPYSRTIQSGIIAENIDGKYFINQNAGTLGRLFFSNVNLEDDNTMYYHMVINNDQTPATSNPGLLPYCGPHYILGTVTYEKDGKTGYLCIKFTESDGIDFRICSNNGDDIVYLGAITGAKFNYPDTGSLKRGNENYSVTVKMNRKNISIWVNGKLIANNLKFSAFGTNPVPLKMNDFYPGIVMLNSHGSLDDFYFWCATDEAPKNNLPDKEVEKPVFDNEIQINLTPNLQPVYTGESGKYDLLEDKTATIYSEGVGDGEGTDSGVYFGTDIMQSKSMYFKTVIKSDRVVDDSISTAEIYSGPVIRLADAWAYTSDSDIKQGFLDILFTEKDGIDMRLRSKDGSNITYIGAITIGTKLPYPDTHSSIRGNDDYEVVIVMNHYNISMWVNGQNMLNEFKLYDIPNFDNKDIHVDILDYAPGVLFNSQIGKVSEFTVWCDKDSLLPPMDNNILYPSTIGKVKTNGNNFFNSLFNFSTTSKHSEILNSFVFFVGIILFAYQQKSSFSNRYKKYL